MEVAPMSDSRDYDVSISFVRQDEGLALELRERLAPLRVFVYSKEQEEVAGNEGVEAFREVFRHRSLVPVVLHRARWGHTPWTRVEETAIRDYLLEAGWMHFVFVKIEVAADVPRWVPDSYIYLDLETYGLEQLVGIIKAKCASLGVAIRPPSLEEKVRAAAASERFAKETEMLKDAGPEPFYDAVGGLYTALDAALQMVKVESGWDIVFGHDRSEYVIAMGRVSMQLCPFDIFANSCRDAVLTLRTFQGRVLTPDERHRGMGTWSRPVERSSSSFGLARVSGIGWCWEVAGRALTPEEAAEHVVTELLKARQRSREWPASL